MSELTHQGAFRLIYKRRRTEAEQGALQNHLQYCPECRQDAEMAGLFNDHLLLKELPTRPSPQFSAVYREQAARRSRRSQIMKPIYAVGGAAALALLMLAGWFIIRSNIQTTGLVEAPELPAISVSEPQTPLDVAANDQIAEILREAGAEGESQAKASTIDEQLIDAVTAKDVASVERLLDAGASPDTIDSDGAPILKTAITMRGEQGIEIVSLLVDNGAKVNVFDRRGNALLPYAAQEGKLEIVQMLLDAGINVDGTYTENIGTNNTALSVAVYRNHKEIVELLIAHGANLNHAETGSEYTPLGYAAYQNNHEIIKILLENGADHTLRNTIDGGQTPLHGAVRRNAVEVVQALLDGGADVEALTDSGQTPLIYLMSEGYRVGLTQVAVLLLDGGADPDRQDEAGNSALHYAAGRGINEAIPLLIERGASVDLENNQGQTARDVAANDNITEMLREAGAVEGSQAETAVGSLDEQLIEAVANKDAVLVNQLLNAGANPNTLDNEGSALLPLAANGSQLEIVRHLLDAGADINGTHSTNFAEEGTALLWAAVRDDIDVVRLLIANGADLDRPETLYNRSPLFPAAAYNHGEVIKILLESGADPNFHSNWGNGHTPLHYAVSNSSQEAVQALIEGGADLDSQTDGGVTPMMMARDSELLSIFLDSGANPDVQDNSGDTALHRAALANNDDFVSILIEYGADVGIENLEGQTALDLATDDKVIETLREANSE
jgi:ankyrin repeat protein